MILLSPVPDNNLIRFDRIMSGEDKRTSCILRNLPNRMTQVELMAVSIQPSMQSWPGRR